MLRRDLLAKTAALVSSPLAFPAVVRCANPNSFLQVACIGVARMGGNTMRSVSQHPKVRIVALCDLDARHMREGAREFRQASQHTCWRQMLADHADEFDAVTIGTPDHMHAPMAVTALRQKKHVYLQKPMAPTIHECRVIAQESAKAGVVTQLGNQGRSSIDGRMMVELLRTKAVGPIKEVILWENKPLNWWPENTRLRKRPDPVPEGLDWNGWVGVREERPYHAKTYHPQTWRAWRDFGVGQLGDMGCHHFDSTMDGLGLAVPNRVCQTHTQEAGESLWATHRRVEFEFTGHEGNDRVQGNTLKLTWYDGDLLPDKSQIPLPKGMKEIPQSGGLWVGTKGSIFKPYAVQPFVMPESSFPRERYPRDLAPQNHYHDWVDAILGGRKACSDFEHAAKLTETVLVGTLAEHAADQWLEWDRAAMHVTNVPEVNTHVQRSYRDGWKIEGLG
ncbi:MAG: Gfo/Idh/MocA family protein [Verrucomicrobium sp.]